LSVVWNGCRVLNLCPQCSMSEVLGFFCLGASACRTICIHAHNNTCIDPPCCEGHTQLTMQTCLKRLIQNGKFSRCCWSCAAAAARLVARNSGSRCSSQSHESGHRRHDLRHNSGKAGSSVQERIFQNDHDDFLKQLSIHQTLK
jgi:hypothetical protein